MRNEQDTAIEALMEQLIANGSEDMGVVFAGLFDLAMRIERERFLGAEHYERTPTRRCYANGTKPKRLDTPAGSLTVNVPKTAGHDEPFYPASLERGLAEYNKATALGGDPKRDSERENIEPMLEQALACLKDYGEAEVPPGGQEKISLNCVTDDWTFPIIGFLDMRFPKVNKIVDLKTTVRMPSVMSPAHQRQRVIYAKATGDDVEFCYSTPKKAELKADGNIPDVLAEIKTHLVRLERFLQLDAETIKACVPVQPYSFYWRGMEDARKELFNL